MTVKVFCEVATINGYSGSPVDGFTLTVPFHVFESEGGVDNGPRDYQDNAVVTVELGGTPIDVFAEVYAQVLASCATNSYATPGKGDIFGYVPNAMTTLLPEIPQIA